jgi:hypothetical protein
MRLKQAFLRGFLSCHHLIGDAIFWGIVSFFHPGYAPQIRPLIGAYVKEMDYAE